MGKKTESVVLVKEWTNRLLNKVETPEVEPRTKQYKEISSTNGARTTEHAKKWI